MIVDNNYKMNLLVRTDLGMGKGKMVAQACHAAVLCGVHAYIDYTDEKNDKYVRWFKDGCQKKIAVRVDNLQELEKYEKQAIEAGLFTAKITDFGLTQLEPHTVTCLGIGPDEASKIDAIVGHLKLL